jgi:signal transduction histidine kinase
MPLDTWLVWPSREALSREARTAARRALAWLTRILTLGGLLWATIADAEVRGWPSVGLAAGGLCGYGAAGAVLWGYFRTTLEHRLWPSVSLLAALVGGGFVAHAAGSGFGAAALWFGSVIVAMGRLPLFAALPMAVVALTAYGVLQGSDNALTGLMTSAGIVLVGYVSRLDSEARGNTQRLLVQERAARKAEAVSAALAERARIAREIHDVLAHSLSAQAVHLEAARMLIERGAEREEVLRRVVDARRMAREGLAETRQALSALRGEMAPVEEFLRELVSIEGAGLELAGESRALPAEAGLAVRRVAQEAMTNVRKHAPGAKVDLRLEYRPEEVELVVRDSGGRRPVDNSLEASGAGYGLRGMRERAELLGGALDAGPAEEGFVVRLRVPV